jgi:L-seryl-tRNA(Ser) seleniumtransferase
MAIEVVPSDGYVGAGSLPLATIPSIALAWRPRAGSANAATARLRTGVTPLVARAERDRVVVDLRTIPAECDEELAEALAAAER